MQLVSMIEQLGCPHLFFTLSAADLHWPDLHRLIEEQRAVALGCPPLDLNQLNENARYDRRVDNLTKYPHIVASFLQARVHTFLATLKKSRVLTMPISGIDMNGSIEVRAMFMDFYGLQMVLI